MDAAELVAQVGPVEALYRLEALERCARQLAAEDEGRGWFGRADAHDAMAAHFWCEQRNLVAQCS